MSDGSKMVLLLIAMLGVPQVVGFGVSRLLSRWRRSLEWVWPPAAALAFGVGWHLLWTVPTQAQAGRYGDCSGATFFVPLLFIPAHLFVATIAQASLAGATGRRKQSFPG